jgi:hypothetical protein
LDIFSAYILAVGLQRYGQNERSLFTFLESEFENSQSDHKFIYDIYDYLQHEFFSYLRSNDNYDYNGWRRLSHGIERAETILSDNIEIGQAIIKTIGLVSMLGHKGANVDQSFLENYLQEDFSKKRIKQAIKELESKKIILYTKYNNSYRIIDGTDVDFEQELKVAEREVDDVLDISRKVKEHFQFSYLNAKAVTYQLGTPRFFEFIVSEEPIQQEPKGQIDK